MKAMVKTAPEPGALSWQDWPDPELRRGQVIVEIERAGICSTDVAIYDWSYRGRQPVRTPSILGHEAAGVVTAVADDVSDVPPGSRVALQVIWGRPHSRQSLRGHENLDPDWIHIGASALGGAFAERIALPAERVVKLPDSVGWEDAVLLEPLAVASNALDLVNPRQGESFAVVGPGPFGLLMIQVARAAAAARVVAVGLKGIDGARLETARRLGAHATFECEGDPLETAEAVKLATGGEGADVVIDAGGTSESTFLSLEIAAPGGRVALFGFTLDVRIEPLRQIIRKGLSLYGVSAAARRHYGIALGLIETGVSRPHKIVSHRLPMERTADGIELVSAREATKVLLSCR